MERPALEQPQYSEHAQQLIQLLQRVARAYQRTGILHETDDKRYQAIFSSPHWDELRQLLTAHGVVSEEMREARGANVRGFRLRANYDELLAERASELPHSSTSSLWAELRAV